MKVQSSLAINFLFVLPVLCHAQGVDKKILFTVNGRPTEAGEFIRMYRKSNDTTRKEGVDDYLQQYINFKLKVADAIEMGYDTSRAFRAELEGYRKQLAQNYLTDPEAKEQLLIKAYERYLTEVSAMHILTAVSRDASPADTMLALKKSSAIRERIISGEPFDKVARETSDDPSAKQNGGNLGYFTVFQMITPFEDAAYKLNPGEISGPVRTPFGYHIIKVTDKRPSRGKVKVAHIMKAAPPGTSDSDLRKAETDINAIYDQLQSGISFRELAARSSDHKESSQNGGELGWFGTGEIIPEFSEAAFAIPDTGKYSKPFRTIYGWHIIKLLDRQKPGNFEETRKYLESRINPSAIEAAGRNSLINRLKQEYHFTVNNTAREWFIKNTDTLVVRGRKKYDAKKITSLEIYSFNGRKLPASDFAAYLEANSGESYSGSIEKFIDSAIETRSAADLLQYEDSNLEVRYPDFRYLMNEFHDGILMFDASEKMVWNKLDGSSDEAGQKRLEDDWLKQLKGKFNVKIDNSILEEVKNKLTNE